MFGDELEKRKQNRKHALPRTLKGAFLVYCVCVAKQCRTKVHQRPLCTALLKRHISFHGVVIFRGLGSYQSGLHSGTAIWHKPETAQGHHTCAQSAHDGAASTSPDTSSKQASSPAWCRSSRNHQPYGKSRHLWMPSTHCVLPSCMVIVLASRKLPGRSL